MKQVQLLFCSLLLTGLLLTGCSAVRDLTIPVSIPPAVMLPETIQSVGIVNRTRSDEGGNKVINVAEGVLTGEGINEDRDGAIACLSGAETQLNLDNLVRAEILDTVTLFGYGTGAMPLPLAWEQIESLCKTHGKDALLVLEAFDTDQSGSVTSNTLNTVINISRGGGIPPPVPSVNQWVYMKTAWRLYDPTNKTILDEVRIDDYFGVSTHPFDLGEFRKRSAIQQSGYIAGRSYGNRFFPSWIQVRREYYKRKGPQMKTADRMVRVNSWEDARSVWEPLTSSSKRKLAGRACYNMAIYYEVQGDFDAAIDWATKAYTQFNEKRSRNYVRILRNRQAGGL